MSSKTQLKKMNSNLLYEKLLTNNKKKLSENETVILNNRILELKQLTTVPKIEKNNEMPHFQVFKPDYLEQADLLFMPTGAFGFKYILVIVDANTKKCDAEAIKNKLSSTVMKALIKIYKRGIVKEPKILSVDGGSEFKDEFKTYCEKNNIILKVGHTNRHRQQALVETRNKIIGSNLLNLLSHKELDTGKYSKDWTKHLRPLISLINDNLPKPITKEIFTEPILSDKINNNDMLPIGTKVRIKLDVNKDITGKKLIGWRSGDIRWSRNILEIENMVLKAGFPIMYTLKNENNIFRTRQQLQVL